MSLTLFILKLIRLAVGSPVAVVADKIKQGDKLGYLTDLFGNTITVYNAEQDGIILYQCSALAAPKGTILVTYGKVKNN